ncbi:MAG: hypothetical protein JWP74_3013 [Marmoricola sp.]|nr:hypothetical protein [Marmoricola sp.]
MTIQWRLRWTAVVATCLLGVVGEPLANSIQNYPFQYGDVFWIVGLGVVPFLAVPTWRNTAKPLLGWVQIAHPLFYSLGFYWQYPLDSQSWLWPLLVFLGNLSFVAYWWLNAIDDDGQLRNRLAQAIIGVGTIVWTGIGLIILLCYVPESPSAPHSDYAVFSGGALYRSLFSESSWSPGLVIYKGLLISVAALTVWLALHARPHEKRTRWLIATMAIVGACWGSGLDDVGDNWLLGPDGLLATVVTFAEFVVIPYLVVVLTAHGRQRERIEVAADQVDA